MNEKQLRLKIATDLVAAIYSNPDRNDSMTPDFFARWAVKRAAELIKINEEFDLEDSVPKILE